jgi:predicted outer membrane repeat protein
VEPSSVSIEGSTFKSTYAKTFGGALSVQASKLKVSVNIISSTFDQCKALDEGGAIYAVGSNDFKESCAVNVQSSTFHSNSATNGGAITARNAVVTLSGIGNIFTQNKAHGTSTRSKSFNNQKGDGKLKIENCITNPSTSLVRPNSTDNIHYDFNGCPYTCADLKVPYLSQYGCIGICSFAELTEGDFTIADEGCKLTKQIEIQIAEKMIIAGKQGNDPLNELVASENSRHFQNSGVLEIKYVRLTNGVTLNDDSGGSILIVGWEVTTTTTIIGSMFIGNIAANKGGAVALSGKDKDSRGLHLLTVENSTFENCQSKYGGAIFITGISTTIIDNTLFKNNEATERSGAIEADGKSIITFTGGKNIFSGNKAPNSVQLRYKLGRTFNFSTCPSNTYAESRGPEVATDGTVSKVEIATDFTGCPFSCQTGSQTFGSSFAYRVNSDHDTWCLHNDKTCRSAGRGLSGNSCPACTPGFFQKDIGGNTCKACVVGQYSNENAGVDCKACLIGYYTNKLSSKQCVECRAGMYTTTKKTEDCKSCPAGWNQLQPKQSRCEECSINTFGPEAGWGEACLPCARALTRKSTECPGCNPGKRILDLSSQNSNWIRGMNCSDCPIGYFTLSRDYASCMLCPNGFYARDNFMQPDRNNRSSCASCPKGMYGVTEGAISKAASCHNCVAGRFSNEFHLDGAKDESTPCTACPPGQWSDTPKLDQELLCKNCKSGRYSMNAAADQEELCIECREGSYSAIAGLPTSTGCKSCPEGFAQSGSGQSYCVSLLFCLYKHLYFCDVHIELTIIDTFFLFFFFHLFSPF